MTVSSSALSTFLSQFVLRSVFLFPVLNLLSPSTQVFVFLLIFFDIFTAYLHTHNVPFIVSPYTAALSHKRPAFAESWRAEGHHTRDRYLKRTRQAMKRSTKWLIPVAAGSNPLRARIVPTPYDDMALWKLQFSTLLKTPVSDKFCAQERTAIQGVQDVTVTVRESIRKYTFYWIIFSYQPACVWPSHNATSLQHKKPEHEGVLFLFS
jgi:hypothetical protein